ncbi:MAG TPA: hypothetical protein VKQ30_00525 [Ktedonobacterales bacterium]|nr:hypothetical protein [Ktedonobacterales bacterium]
MTIPSTPSSNEQPKDATYWAQDITTLKVGTVPPGAVNLNVEGRRIAGPLQGFGPMWQKTYRVRLADANVTPREVIAVWKQNFPQFWPRGNRFYAPLTGIAPGEVALLNLKTGGMPLSTGVLVLYADDESFTLMTPQGHMFAGWITFSAYDADLSTMAQTQVLMRASDPIYELGLRFGGHQQEDRFWQHTLTALAAHFGAHEPVQTETTCIDPKIQWSQARNIWQNAAARTMLTAPTRWFRRGR